MLLFGLVGGRLVVMNESNSTHVIAAPLDPVFAAFSDFAAMPGRIKGIKRVEMLTPAPVGIGTHFRETRQMHGRDATEEMEVTAFDSPTMYAVSCRSCGCRITTTFHFEQSKPGTRVSFDIVAQPTSWFTKLLYPLRRLLIGMIQKCVTDDVLDLKRALETPVAAAAK